MCLASGIVVNYKLRVTISSSSMLGGVIMPVDFEAIVVGGGAMGSAAAYHLAKAGVSVLLLEQFEIGHENGASHGDSRIIRLSYDHPTYTKLARESYKLWAELEADAGEKVVT